jgi:ATP-dependent helicase/nuclease subunit B
MTERAADVPLRVVPVRPCPPPAPIVGDRLPRTWSASAVESLRQCPYQFFARAVLGLREDDELDDEVDKRDFGAWLHATLERFHALRRGPASVEVDIVQLVRAGRDALEAIVGEGQVDAAALLPYTAGFDAFARRYVAWLHAHEHEGWRYEAGEVARTVAVEGDDGLRLRGRIDRLDRHVTQAAVHVIDYKTGARDQLTRRVNQPLEDTQLAVYAALLQSTLTPGTELSAAYLALDDSNGIVEIAHPNVADTATELLRALADERRRMRSGVPLPPLGQGSVCEHCEARGLCRRDHWAAPEAT